MKRYHQINILCRSGCCANDRLRTNNNPNETAHLFRCETLLRNKTVWQQGCAC